MAGEYTVKRVLSEPWLERTPADERGDMAGACMAGKDEEMVKMLWKMMEHNRLSPKVANLEE